MEVVVIGLLLVAWLLVMAPAAFVPTREPLGSSVDRRPEEGPGPSR